MRGFSYVRQEDGFHYWRQHGDEIDNTEVSLWESEGGVWVCASTSDTGLPMEATLITDVWKDTGILPPPPATGLPIDDRVIAIREGTLSPLSIKRPTPILHKSELTENTHETHEEINVQMQHAFDRNVRILGFTAETNAEKDPEVESVLRTRKAICLNVPSTELAAVASAISSKPRCQIGGTVAGSDASLGSGERYPEYSTVFRPRIRKNSGTTSRNARGNTTPVYHQYR